LEQIILVDRKGPAPVVLFIHGESYDYGTGNAYDGSVLSSFADIAVVTVNYRLGPLGNKIFCTSNQFNYEKFKINLV